MVSTTLVIAIAASLRGKGHCQLPLTTGSSSDHTMFFHTMISYHVFPAIFAPDWIFQSIWNSTKFPICIQILIEPITYFKHHSFYVYLSTEEFSAFKYLLLSSGLASSHKFIIMSIAPYIWYVIANVVISPPCLIPIVFCSAEESLPALYDAEGALLGCTRFLCWAFPWSMFPAAESVELPQDECSDQWKSPGQRAFSVPSSHSINLLSGGVGRAPLPCRTISCGRTRLWTNALVDERAQIEHPCSHMPNFVNCRGIVQTLVFYSSLTPFLPR